MENLPAKIKTEVNATLQAIKDKMASMEKKNQSGNKTSGLFQWNGRRGIVSPNSEDAIKIMGVTDIALLLHILGFIMTRKDEYEAAAEELDLQTFPAFAWGGFSFADWKHDIDIRISVIMHAEEVKKLQEAETFLSQYVSTEDKLAKMLENIKGIL